MSGGGNSNGNSSSTGTGISRIRRTLRRTAATAVVVVAAGLGLGAAHAGAQAQPRADYQAVAHPVTGHVGQTVEVELGVRNGGPGGGGGRAYEVVAPEGTTIVATATTANGTPPCRPKGSDTSRTYLCAIGEDFPAGDRETLRFRVRIDEKVDGAEGRVRIVGRDEDPEPDPDPGNDSAPIPVEVTDAPPAPAPKTAHAGNPHALLIATTSGTALSAGVLVLGAVRRRAH
ncbi:hypothetical protein [Streptomyces sp. NPDC053079]|uniref:hypothetical protein n=1 Tax=Streptomyces sp. NPDC053079 TaxID=3365697 RepID=UPI0037D2104B